MKVIVFGDIMTDIWQTVDPTRVSSEAPVLIAQNKSTKLCAGGAANAAKNCAALGATVDTLGVVDCLNITDEMSRVLHTLELGPHFVHDPRWSNIIKHRIVDTEGRQILRIDSDPQGYTMSKKTYKALVAAFKLCASGADALLISDYAKGTCDRILVIELVVRAHELGMFVVVNGKPGRSTVYAGVDVLVVNKAEAEELLGRDSIFCDRSSPYSHTKRQAEELRTRLSVKNMVVTDGADGLYWADGLSLTHVLSPKVPVADGAGAGDTICATIAAAGRIDQTVLRQATENAASVVAQHGTCIPVKSPAPKPA